MWDGRVEEELGSQSSAASTKSSAWSNKRCVRVRISEKLVLIVVVLVRDSKG